MRLACSTIHYEAAGWPLDRTLQDIAAAGYEGVEVTIGARFSPELLKQGALPRAVLEESGLVPARLMASLFWSGKSSTLAANRVVAEQLLECAADLGTDTVLTATGPWPDELPREEAHEQLVAHLRWLVDQAPGGVRIALEAVGVPWPHSFWPVHNADTFLEYRDAIGPRLLANFDTNNYLSGGDDPPASIERLGDAIAGVHLKDARFRDGRYRNVLAGEGVIDFAACLAALRRVGYDDWLVAEDESWTSGNADGPDRIARLTRAHYSRLLEEVRGA